MGFKNWLKRFLPSLIFIIPVAVFLPILTPGKEIFSIFIFSLSQDGLLNALIIILKITSIINIFTVLVSSAPRQDLLFAASSLGIPSVFIRITEFTFRYFEVIFREAQTMLLARRSRGYETGKTLKLREIQELGNLIGMLFLRSYSRAEKIYLAMLARGYNHEEYSNCSPPLKKSEIAISTAFLMFLICLVLIDKGGIRFWPLFP
ncbi:MAG: cobalt ECF transporter T component CbiQ [Clostridia bacterium]|nr:cobalt ECF transporter T component CbiQ [Clostridia bacterium]